MPSTTPTTARPPSRDTRLASGEQPKPVRPAGAHRWLALTLLCVAQFVDVLGVTVVVVALPHIRGALGFSLEDAQWVVSAYVLPFAGCLLVAGRAGDLYGRRRLFLAGMALFGAASLAGGLAPSAGVLVAARVLQGLGAALVVPSALAMLTTLFPTAAERRHALAVWTAVAALGGAAGFTLGGLVTDGLGWRAVFLLNVPIALTALALAPRLLHESRDARAAGRLDLSGAASVTLGLLLLVFGLTRAQQAGFLSPVVFASLGLGAACLAGFVLIERRVARPLVPPEVFLAPGLLAACLVGAALTATTGPTAVLDSVYLQQVIGASATTTGLLFAPFSLAVVAGSFLGARLVEARGQRATIVAGLISVAAALGLNAAVLERGGVEALVVALVLAGLGLGAASVAATAAGTSAVGADRQGLASGLLNAAAQVGTAVGLATLTALAAARTAGVGGTDPAPAALVDGLGWAIWAASGIAVVAGLGAAWYRWTPDRAVIDGGN